MSKPSLVIVLLEDERQQMLIYRYLIRRGLNSHAVRIRRSPSGQGSAEAWVRRNFVNETREYRRRQARAQSALIVVLDADTSTVQDRLNQLCQALSDSDNDVIAEGEHVALLVPKRNVETWILCLNGNAVSEQADYKTAKDDWNILISTASETLHTWTRSQDLPPNHCVESLRIGVRELRRLPF